MTDFDVIVVGGGHAGTEAGAASARRGARTLLITKDPGRIGEMSCNPSIGGLGKGHLVRELDALDGLMARAADRAAIHRRILNASKGAAVRGPRVQADRSIYRIAIQDQIAVQPGLTVASFEVDALHFIEGMRVGGVVLCDGSVVTARSVVLTTGTFLGGLIFRGDERLVGGRIGEHSAMPLADQLRSVGFPMARLKTGTPPRLDGRTIDWAALERQPSDPQTWDMSFLGSEPGRRLPQLDCAITRTTERTHEIIREALPESPLFSGAIQGHGPRYCPSIEDKVVRFGDRSGHQVFLEPEGLDTHLVYPNGLSTSLSTRVQIALLRTIPGLSQVEMVVPGYAVEYDHVDPRNLDRRLAVRDMGGLFMAGQVNGTTGYEEAAAQGLIAGANAAAVALGLEPLMLDRGESYSGVLVDDLCLQGVTEPYRMLTARAEFRLRLRCDNAASRLTPIGIRLGLIGDRRLEWWQRRQRDRQRLDQLLDRPIGAGSIAAASGVARADGVQRSLREWARYPNIDRSVLARLDPRFGDEANADLIEELLQDAIYAPYVERQEGEVRSLRANDAVNLPTTLDYAAIGGLSAEMIERLSRARPSSLGAAARVRGITPAALAALLVAVRHQTSS